MRGGEIFLFSRGPVNHCAPGMKGMINRMNRFRSGSSVVILAAFSLLLAACGQDNEKCFIDCQDVTVPESKGN